MYLAIGKVESIGSRDPEMQLAIGALGMLAKRMLAKRKTTKIGAVLMRRNFDCWVFLGTCSWGEHGYGSVTFKRVNRTSGYRLEDPEQLELFSRTIVAVAKLIPDSRLFSPA